MNSTRIAFMVALTPLLAGSLHAQTGDSLIVELSRKWVHAKAYALKMAELMPESSYDFKPVASEMSYKEQMLHLADNIVWLSTSYLSPNMAKPKIDTSHLSKADVIKIVGEAYDIGLRAQASLSPAQLDKQVKFFAGPMTVRQILLLLHDHQSHHLGQMIVYLRLKGIRPPDYVGW
ncbi:MAG: DinB family protein [Bacteroidetes bacterium]|nr:DinB family protein [Bacteroidota bacterium]